jgi:hypothetical protein
VLLTRPRLRETKRCSSALAARDWLEQQATKRRESIAGARHGLLRGT